MTAHAKLLASLIGATASGKTGVAVRVAELADVEVVSADSRQIYRGLDVGTAKPNRAEREAAVHHGLDLADPEETFTANAFADAANRSIDAIRSRGRVPLLVGGSGLYLRAVEEGLFEGPGADPELRAQLETFAAERGREALHARLAAVDPESAARLPPADLVRVVRALEVWELTGETLSEHHRKHRELRESGCDVRRLRFGLDWPATLLDRRIAERVASMLDGGWIEEVERLLDHGVPPEAPALRALGYPDVREHLGGVIDRAEAERRIVLATRRYAKRQRTWFRAVRDVRWFQVRSEEDLASVAPAIAATIRAAADPG